MYKPYIGNIMIMILPSDLWWFIDLFITDILYDGDISDKSRIWGYFVVNREM